MQILQLISSSEIIGFIFLCTSLSQWNSGISLKPWAQWQCWPRRALRSIAVAWRTRRFQVTSTCHVLTGFLLLCRTFSVFFSHRVSLLCILHYYYIDASQVLSLFNCHNPPLSIHTCIMFSSCILTVNLALFIFVSLGQAVSRRMRPTSPPTWRPSLRCRRRGHQGRRPGSRLQRGGARSGPLKPLSSPRSGIHKTDTPKYTQVYTYKCYEWTHTEEGSKFAL